MTYAERNSSIPYITTNLPVFWSIGYAVNSYGGAPLEKVKEYIRNQDR
ncbi:MAG: transposase [Cyanobacteria bacterium P01_A01_bin.83]